MNSEPTSNIQRVVRLVLHTKWFCTSSEHILLLYNVLVDSPMVPNQFAESPDRVFTLVYPLLPDCKRKGTYTYSPWSKLRDRFITLPNPLSSRTVHSRIFLLPFDFSITFVFRLSLNQRTAFVQPPVTWMFLILFSGYQLPIFLFILPPAKICQIAKFVEAVLLHFHLKALFCTLTKLHDLKLATLNVINQF